MAYNKGFVSQSFNLIFILIIIFFLLVIGFKGLSLLNKNSCSVSLNNLKNDIRNNFLINKNYGVKDKVILKTPCYYDYLCFIPDKKNVDGNNPIPTELSGKENNIIYSRSNIFLIKKGLVIDLLNSSLLKGENLCIPYNNGFTFIINGLGSAVSIEKLNNG